MIKRYQVFVSSTYADLKEERSKVIQTIMELDCIPAGMEIFPAIDDDQFNFIKSIIDDCDYYILIVGGRYGSISEDGVSYTEKEYEYAISQGIKVIAFLHESPDEISLGKSEKDEKARQKLQGFREKVSTNRLIKFWNKADDLPGLVALSLSKTIKTYPAIGWIRANAVTNPELLQELNEQRKENADLKEKVSRFEKFLQEKKPIDNLAAFDDKFKIMGTARRYQGAVAWSATLTWREIFSLISPYLLHPPTDTSAKSTLSRIFFDVSDKDYEIHGEPKINDQIFQTIKIHLKALHLIDVEYTDTTDGGANLFWSLTDEGEKEMIRLRSVSKN